MCTLQVSDGLGGESTATVHIIVNSVNDAPVATDDTASTDEDVAVAQPRRRRRGTLPAGYRLPVNLPDQRQTHRVQPGS